MRLLEDMLALSPWTRELSAEHLSRVRAAIIVREFEAGSTVCRKGDPASAWIGVIDGLVKLHSLSPSGKSVTFAGIPAGGWFGEGSVLKGEPLKYNIVALRDSRIALMPEATFRWLLDTSIPFNRFLLTQLNERLGQFIGMVEHDRLARTGRTCGARWRRYSTRTCTPTPSRTSRFRRKNSVISPAPRASGSTARCGCSGPQA